MNPSVLHDQTRILFIQRNCLGIAVCLLLVSNLCLAVVAINKQERVIIVPATLSREVVVEDGQYFSESYLEEITLFFSDLLLNLTPENISYKSSILLKYVHPDHYHELKSYFKSEEKKYREYGLTTRFDCQSIKIFKMSAEVTGTLYSKFGTDGESHKQSTFEIEYMRSQGVLQIKSFKLKVAND